MRPNQLNFFIKLFKILALVLTIYIVYHHPIIIVIFIVFTILLTLLTVKYLPKIFDFFRDLFDR
jgi:hypothetical protein